MKFGKEHAEDRLGFFIRFPTDFFIFIMLH